MATWLAQEDEKGARDLADENLMALFVKLAAVAKQDKVRAFPLLKN